MNIEILFKELYIYGEDANANYLEMMFEGENIINTSFVDSPFFLENRPDLIFIGPISEHYLDKIVEKLLPFKKRLQDLIEDGVTFIIMNNSMDIFGKKLQISGFDKEHQGKCLGLLNYTSHRNYDNRYARLAIVNFNGLELVGHNMGFSQYYYQDENDHLYTMQAGFGFNKKSKFGGFRYKNVFCTELVGELFMVNPPLAKTLLNSLGKNQDLPYEKQVYDIYNYRLEKMKKDPIVNQEI
ncbi:MAG: hypothetical protein Q4E50_06045 [Tissierellia bacterium]|nr:hypothetical protein [Tissierellia bacterium]